MISSTKQKLYDAAEAIELGIHTRTCGAVGRSCGKDAYFQYQDFYMPESELSAFWVDRFASELTFEERKELRVMLILWFAEVCGDIGIS